MSVRTKKCASCPQWFFWARTERGGFVPLNEDPAIAGEYVLMDTTQPPTALRFDSLAPIDAIAFRDRYDHHAKTCSSEEARRRRAAKGGQP